MRSGEKHLSSIVEPKNVTDGTETVANMILIDVTLSTELQGATRLTR